MFKGEIGKAMMFAGFLHNLAEDSKIGFVPTSSIEGEIAGGVCPAGIIYDDAEMIEVHDDTGKTVEYWFRRVVFDHYESDKPFWEYGMYTDKMREALAVEGDGQFEVMVVKDAETGSMSCRILLEANRCIVIRNGEWRFALVK